MPRYSYEAINETGMSISGVIEAETLDAARTLLLNRGYIPSRVAGASERGAHVRIDSSTRATVRGMREVRPDADLPARSGGAAGDFSQPAVHSGSATATVGGHPQPTLAALAPPWRFSYSRVHSAREDAP